MDLDCLPHRTQFSLLLARIGRAALVSLVFAVMTQSRKTTVACTAQMPPAKPLVPRPPVTVIPWNSTGMNACPKPTV